MTIDSFDKKNLLSKMADIHAYVFPEKGPTKNYLFLFSILILFFAKIVSISSLVVYKYAVEFLISPSEEKKYVFISMIVIYAVMRIVGIITSELRDLFFTNFAQNIIKKIGLLVFEHMHNLSLRYHLDRRMGETSLSIEKGLKSIETLSIWAFFYMVPFLIEILIMFFVMFFFLSFSVFLISAFTITSYISFTIIFVHKRTKVRKEINKQNGLLHSIIVESLMNYETIKYFSSEKKEVKKLENCLDNYKKAALDNTKGIALLNISQNCILILSTALTNIIIGQKIYDNAMSLGDLILANMFILQVYSPLTSFGFMYREVKQSLIDIEKMIGLLKEKKEVEDLPSSVPLKVSNGNIVFENVSFGYETGYPVLDNLNFTLKKSKILAFVGTSGSGKSTIIKLLFRLYDPWSGEIKIDGQNIEKITQKSLRETIGIVPQNAPLFNDTIYANIAYGRSNANINEVEKVARIAQLHGFISKLPDGYNTKVGEQGLKLSGGEKQRIAIARLLLKEPSIIVFDEATSSLDYQNEKNIQKCIHQISKEKSTIIIAHRLSTVAHADEIIYLENGRIAERGNHKTLLKKGGKYASLWEKQFDKDI